MSSKRPREGDSTAPVKKQRKGFSVGPANLPDGTYKRKVQKIKKDLIHKAKLKKEYAKLKAREPTVSYKSVYDQEDDREGAPEETEQPVESTEHLPEPTTDPHPDRLRLLERPPTPEPDATSGHARNQDRRQRRPRPQAYKREEELAQKRKEEVEARQRAREEAEQQRRIKLAERDRFRKTMAKARGKGPDGKRKLGKESTVLLEKVKRLTGRV
ncbi:hypothetical protein B0J11DRAFT_265052 [Dendryphion nanum]|uniref:rRNA-processing protein FYV7 n=1 Tax=Dendryphion nanum TaxID=256645 RepID=A0A9P9E1D8_9PLEO|nr:hypothetical protein B0J11DRAFT_265052 [Dendryphion nanum]